MLAHFAGDVSQNVTLTGQIDAKHRARQHLRYRPLSDDLCLFCHAIKCQRAGKLQPTPQPTIEALSRRFMSADPALTGATG